MPWMAHRKVASSAGSVAEPLASGKLMGVPRLVPARPSTVFMGLDLGEDPSARSAARVTGSAVPRARSPADPSRPSLPGGTGPRPEGGGQRPRWWRPSLFWLFFLSLIMCAPSRPVRAAAPDPTNASLLGGAGTLLPTAVGASLLLGEDATDDDVRYGSAVAALALGTVVGPSLGQFYAGAGTDAVVTLLLRAATGGLSALGLTLAVRGSEAEETPGIALLVLGAIPTLILAAYDIVDAADSARQRRIQGAHRDELRDLASVARCGPLPCQATVDRSAYRDRPPEGVLSEGRAP